MAPPKSEEERQKLIQEFRRMSLRYIKEGYWTTDDYISKWLEDKNYNVERAEKAFRKMLKWRIDNKVHEVLDENMEDLMSNVVYYLDGVDNKGRPVLCLPCDDCNVKDKIAVKTESEKIERVFYQILEKMVEMMKNSSLESGGKISTFVAIIDVEGVDVKFVTPQMIKLIIQVSKLVEDNYPGMMESCYIINASKAIKNLYGMIKPALRTVTTSRVKMFSNKRFKWEPAILENVPADQLRQRFGGTLDDTLTNRKTI